MFKMLGLFVGFVLVGLASSAKFDELFQPSWAMDHFIHEGELLKFKLDIFSGAGFGSKSKYMFGKCPSSLNLWRGRPTYSDAWVDQFTLISGDGFYVNWDEVLVGATAVVSTLGSFGSEEQMRRINGEANVVAMLQRNMVSHFIGC